ncbi:alkaline phosphatase [Effusibacillus lacus]|uniref:Alkaline phosphatase n=1 Tax=Effusibacillus lacus TaxID=1348429 RepID=A0A292YJ04_9BACL|nr:alkaline phosphatase [Effusibacillus lacus]TCS69807.1 alkaline phosphatase [Effusibacillus lacus]GAX88889.1 alkaline phosphatase [Effusibacillus lacus]
MRRKLSWKLAVAMLGVITALSTVPQSALFAEGEQTQPQASPAITILPIDRATILAGQKFDFRVELNNGIAKKENIKVTINGIDAEKFFGKTADRTNSNENSAEFTIRSVSFDKAGAVEVKAEVKIGDKTLTKTVKYEVYQAFGNGKKAKNVILMIGDGMSANIRTAARVVAKGIEEGKFKGWLEMEKMDHMGMVTTSGMDSIVTDSANSASAYATGHKTAVSAEGVYPDNTSDPLDDPRVENIVEMVKRTKGMATGIVTTSDVTDATPAAMATHTRKRSTSEAIVNMFFEHGSRPDVLMGGGSAWFLPADKGGKRKDGKNMIEAFKAEGYSYAANAAELNKLGDTDKILGLFKSGNMDVYFDREYRPNNGVLGKDTDQPNLMEMTAKAIDALDNNKNGFFLMVEAASIDKQAHPMDMERLIWDTIEFDKTVGLAKKYAEEHKDTLVIVTSDHGHSMTLNGTYNTKAAEGKTGEELREFVGTYENSKFPTYEDKDGDGFPDNPDSEWKLAVGWGNHPDYNDDFLTNQKPMSPTIQDPNVKDKPWYIANPDRDPNGVHFTGNLPHDEAVEVHTFDDVPINAMGPGSELFTGYMDNTEVFRKMVTALGINAVQSEKSRK